MIGQNIDAVSKPNMTSLQQKSRRKNKEKPSGRKAPRVKDFNATQGITEEEEEEMMLEETPTDNHDLVMELVDTNECKSPVSGYT